MNKAEIEQEYRRCAGELQTRQAQHAENARIIEQLIGRLQLLKELYDKEQTVPTNADAEAPETQPEAKEAVLEVVS